MRNILFFATVVIATPSLLTAQEQPQPTIAAEAAEMQAVPALSPDDSLQAIELRDGFRVELVAAEPLIHDPVAIDFDEYGRIYVVQLPSYNAYAMDNSLPAGSIARLEDADGDGRFDKSSVFATGLNYPTAIAVWDGGVFVGDAPDLLYLKDTDGDGQADSRRVVLTGFGSDEAGEAHLNSFRWGFDNRLHFSTSLSGGDVRNAADESATPVSVRQRGLRLDPRDWSDFQLTSGGGQHGMSMDDFGRKFVCSNSVPAQTLIYDDAYLSRNPHLAAPDAAIDIAPDGKFTKLYRISPPEPWRELRTRLRSSGRFRGSDEGGKPFGFFTGATGITIYRGDAWPAEYRGNLIVGDVANNLVYRARLQSNGVSLTAHRADPEREFLASRDIWFRPVQFSNAPDGSLYVIDMYRSLIEGAAFLPPEFLKVLDVLGGQDRGRLYRIVHEDAPPRAMPRLGELSTAQLAALLEHPNGWHRDTAGRIIYQRQDRQAVGRLRELVRSSQSPVGRMTAMHSLHGLDALDEATLQLGLADPDRRVRIQSVRLAEQFVEDSTDLQSALITLASKEADLEVRYQLAFSLGSFEAGRGRTAALAKLALGDGADPWMQLAIQSSLARGVDHVVQILMRDESFRRTEHGRRFLESLAKQIAAADRAIDIATMIRELNALPAAERALSESLLQALVGERPEDERQKLLTAAGERASELFSRMLTAGRRLLDNPPDSATDDDKLEAIKALGLGQFSEDGERFRALLQLHQPPRIQLAAVDTLARFDDVGVAELLIEAWPRLSPVVRSRAEETLCSRTPWLSMFLAAVKTGSVARADVSSSRVTLLKLHPDSAIRQQVSEVFAARTATARGEVVAAYQSALSLAGEPERGRALFRKNCAACHRLEGFGTAVGADLKAISDRGDASVLLNILDPNREVKPKFVSYLVLTADGRVTSGMIVAENANSLTLRSLDGKQTTIQRIDIEELRSTGVSFMPEGLEKELDQQGMADLLSYLKAFR